MKKVLFIALTSILIWSCSKNEAVPVDSQTMSKDNTKISTSPMKLLADVTFSEGRLIFADEAAVETYFAALDNDPTLISKLNEKFPTFESSYDAYEELMEMSDDAFDQLNLDDYENIIEVVEKNGEPTIEAEIPFILASVIANKNGEFQAGDKVFKLTHETVYELNVADYSAFKAGNQNMRSLTVYPVEVKSISNSRAQLTNCIQSYRLGRTNHRMIGAIDHHASGPFEQVQADTKHEDQNRRGKWKRDRASRMSQTGSIDIKLSEYVYLNGGLGTWVDISTKTESIARSRKNNSRIYKNAKTVFSTTKNLTVMSASTTHKTNGDDGGNRTCYCNL